VISDFFIEKVIRKFFVETFSKTIIIKETESVSFLQEMLKISTTKKQKTYFIFYRTIVIRKAKMDNAIIFFDNLAKYYIY